jgi:hypothetical protein
MLAAWTDWFADHLELEEWGVAIGTLALPDATVFREDKPLVTSAAAVYKA